MSLSAPSPMPPMAPLPFLPRGWPVCNFCRNPLISCLICVGYRCSTCNPKFPRNPHRHSTARVLFKGDPDAGGELELRPNRELVVKAKPDISFDVSIPLDDLVLRWDPTEQGVGMGYSADIGLLAIEKVTVSIPINTENYFLGILSQVAAKHPLLSPQLDFAIDMMEPPQFLRKTESPLDSLPIIEEVFEMDEDLPELEDDEEHHRRGN